MNYIGEFYQGVIFFFAKHILLAMGYTLAQISAVNLSGAYLANFNLAPLVALAIVTPGWGLRERGEMLVIGIPLLFLLHVLDLVAHFPVYFHGLGIARMVVYSIGVAGVAAPFIIWFCIGYRGLFEPRIKIKKREEGGYFCPGCARFSPSARTLETEAFTMLSTSPVFISPLLTCSALSSQKDTRM